MEKDFSKNIIKEYTHWTVYVHENQEYLGRCVVVCKRADALHLTDATDEEWNELHLILKDLQAACNACFHPDWINFSFLGNEWRRLHGHVVPRYAAPKTFMRMTFTDALYGTNFQINHNFVIPEEILQGIKTKLIEALRVETEI